ncbi:MAG: phosphoribosylformylglycinamidine synthase, partial [bacterium]
EGAKLAVAEGCRNLVVTGARPLAATNCLNFASPERPEVMWAFSQVIDGIAEACQAFSTPITGGNVSFYNETEGQGVYPTPVVGLVGLVEDLKHVVTCGFKNPDEVILLLGETKEDLGGSEYLAYLHNQIIGHPPVLNLDYEKNVQQLCLKAINKGLVSSAHDISDGGLLIALAECCLAGQINNIIGATFELDLKSPAFVDNVSLAAALFGESPSRIILSVKESKLAAIEELAKEQGVISTVIGRTGGQEFIVKFNGQDAINEHVVELSKRWQKGLETLLESPIR